VRGQERGLERGPSGRVLSTFIFGNFVFLSRSTHIVSFITPTPIRFGRGGDVCASHACVRVRWEAD
jgi:hypothetical protein